MKRTELLKKDVPELEKQLKELHQGLMKDYVQIASGTTPKNPGNVRKAKKTIARIRTVLTQKQTEANK